SAPTTPTGISTIPRRRCPEWSPSCVARSASTTAAPSSASGWAEAPMNRHVVASADELPPGSSRILDIAGRPTGGGTLEGRMCALRNVCPHHGAPLCLGEVTGRMLPSEPHKYVYGEENQVLRCPWHGYEFRLQDGRSILRPETLRVKPYRVEI